MDNLNSKLSVIISIFTLLTVIFSGCFWVYKTNALPQQVDNHEERIAKLEKQIVENNTKTELIYQAVLEIRRAIIYK